MIVITGSGRSGTSFAAECFQKAGFSVGGDWSARRRAGWENKVVVGINDKLMSVNTFMDCEAAMNLPKKTIEEIQAVGSVLKIVKDPRFNRTLEAWVHAGVIDKVIHMIRPVREVLASDLRINESASTTEETVLAVTGSITMACDIHKIPRVVIQYPEVIDKNNFQSKKLVFEIGLLGGDFLKAKEAVLTTIRTPENV